MRLIEDLLFDFLDGPYLIVSLVVVGVVFVGLLGVAIVADTRAASACLRAGYPSASLDWSLTAYCIKRVDQTDVVVPLATVRGR